MRRQSAVRIAASALLALALGGCTSTGLPFGRPAIAPDPTITGSIAPAVAGPTGDKVESSDWETIRAALAGARAGDVDGIDWLNAETGTTGTMSIEVAVKEGSLSCRSFVTTVNDVHGVRRYRGEACAARGGPWQLRKLAADDAAIS